MLAAVLRLVATARRTEQLRDPVEMYGDQVRAVALDVTDKAAVRMVVGEFASAGSAGEQCQL